MRHFDQRHHPLADRFSKQVGDAVLGDHVVHIGSGHRHALIRAQHSANARRLAIVCGRRQANDRLAALGAGGAAQKLALGGNATVEVTVNLVGAHLARQVDRERLRHRHHLVLGRDRTGVAHHLDRLEGKQRVAVDQVIQTPRPHGETGDDLAGLLGLAPPGQDAVFEQRNDRVGNHIRMNADVLAIRQVFEGFIGDAPQPDLQRGAVLDDAADVARDLFHRLLLRAGVRVFDHRRVDRHQAVDLADVQGRVPHRARHGGVDLGNNELGLGHCRGYHVHRDAQTDVTKLVRHRHLNERHVHGNAPDRHQPRHARDGQGYILGHALLHGRPDIVAHKEGAVAVVREGLTLGVVRYCMIGQEMNQFHIGRPRFKRFQSRHQGARRGAGRAHEHMVTALDLAHGLVRGGDLVGMGAQRRGQSGPGLGVGGRASCTGSPIILQSAANAGEQTRRARPRWGQVREVGRILQHDAYSTRATNCVPRTPMMPEGVLMVTASGLSLAMTPET